MSELQKYNGVEADAWQSLKSLTLARIALGRTGVAMPLKESLDFKMAHAHARDAVYSELNEVDLINDLKRFDLPILTLQSKAHNRNIYLQRPDWGRLLSEESKKRIPIDSPKKDISIIVADGLSATAINTHTLPLLDILIPDLLQSEFTLTPLSIVHQGRVAISDEIGFLLNAQFSIILIGERPGLSSPDSMGAYLTFKPQIGLTDESRNCISNIRLEGLSYKIAAEKILYLAKEAFRLQYSGVALKDNAGLLK